MKKTLLQLLVFVIFSININAQTNWKEKFISKVEISNPKTRKYDEVQIYTPGLKLFVNPEFNSIKITDTGLISRVLGTFQEAYYDQAIFVDGIKANTSTSETVGYRGDFEATNKRGTNHYRFKGTLIFYNPSGITKVIEVRCQQKDGDYRYYRFHIKNEEAPTYESNNSKINYINKIEKVEFKTNKAEERISGITKTNLNLNVDFVIDLSKKFISYKRQDRNVKSFNIIYISETVMDGKSKVLKLYVKDKDTNDIFKIQLREESDQSVFFTMYSNMTGDYDYVTFYKESLSQKD
ncbi:hypothetical protein [Chryseobacterium sp.]|uniref:hypothetical protein n=1 Tax=Chryseobacterium sp. TaxID=1871047 RepID=UPI0028979E02|nr:hypothetical protein [Chryseobacterium sp.]